MKRKKENEKQSFTLHLGAVASDSGLQMHFTLERQNYSNRVRKKESAHASLAITVGNTIKRRCSKSTAALRAVRVAWYYPPHPCVVASTH